MQHLRVTPCLRSCRGRFLPAGGYERPLCEHATTIKAGSHLGPRRQKCRQYPWALRDRFLTPPWTLPRVTLALPGHDPWPVPSQMISALHPQRMIKYRPLTLTPANARKGCFCSPLHPPKPSRLSSKASSSRKPWAQSLVSQPTKAALSPKRCCLPLLQRALTWPRDPHRPQLERA